jgi:beta-phosphoglucomutase-like phosphatase (HAD superfamily)
LYLAALDALGIRPDEAIALEDSPNGITAAKRAGLFCVAVPNPLTCQLPLDHADLRVSSLAALPLARLLTEVQQRLRLPHAPTPTLP